VWVGVGVAVVRVGVVRVCLCVRVRVRAINSMWVAFNDTSYDNVKDNDA
jgi:hypothetical protein